jgi:hypothetical protein
VQIVLERLAARFYEVWELIGGSAKVRFRRGIWNQSELSIDATMTIPPDGEMLIHNSNIGN